MKDDADIEPQESQLKDYDANFMEKALVTSLGISTAESRLNKAYDVKSNIENVGVALDGLYDAHKLGFKKDVFMFAKEMAPVFLKLDEYKISDGILTPEEKAEIAAKTEELEQKYPNVTERYTIHPVISGKYGAEGSEMGDVVVNFDTHADPTEAFSMRIKFNEASKELNIRFDKPIDPQSISSEEKITYVLDKMDIDRETAISAIEQTDNSKPPTKIMESLESAIDAANDKHGGEVELSPALMLTEMRLQTEIERAETMSLSDAKNETNHLSNPILRGY